MAKFELKFIAYDNEKYSIQTECVEDVIYIEIKDCNDMLRIFLDKSTAIKFAKTLRTEINKITESEVNNG